MMIRLGSVPEWELQYIYWTLEVLHNYICVTVETRSSLNGDGSNHTLLWTNLWRTENSTKVLQLTKNHLPK